MGLRTNALAAAMAFLMSVGAARAHIPVPTDPFVRDGCTAGFPNLLDSWAVMGVLVVNGHVGIFCFDAAPGDRITSSVVIPPKAAYEGPNDVTMVLVGHGLPAPSRPVPLGLVEGMGAVFVGPRPPEGDFPKRNFLGWWHGERLDVELPREGRYEVRAFSPSDWKGEYYLVTTGMDPTRPSGALENTPLPTPGDLNHDEKVDLADALQALVIAMGEARPQDSFILAAGDVAPPGDPERFIAAGDGEIDLGDVVRLYRRALGLTNSPLWPDGE